MTEFRCDCKVNYDCSLLETYLARKIRKERVLNCPCNECIVKMQCVIETSCNTANDYFDIVLGRKKGKIIKAKKK